MEKLLKVNKPIYSMEEGEMLNLSEDGKSYVGGYSNETSLANENSDYTVKMSGEVVLSAEYASDLVKAGILEEVKTDEKKENVFDKIDEMIGVFNRDLENLDEDMKNEPEVLKIEKETVLENLLQVLNYLKTLKR